MKDYSILGGIYWGPPNSGNYHCRFLSKDTGMEGAASRIEHVLRSGYK